MSIQIHPDNYKIYKARTEKQKAQWKQFNELGTLVGTARWISSKRQAIIRIQGVDPNILDAIVLQINSLERDLIKAAQQKGWKPK